MAFCTSCGTKVESVGFCGTCGAAVNAKSTPSPAPVAPVASSTHSETREPATGGAVTLIVFAAVGAVSPWLPWIKDGYDNSINGWDSQKALGYLDKFSSGTTISLAASVCALVAGLSIYSRQRNTSATPMSKTGIGWLILVSGLSSLLGAGATYNGWDEAATDAGETLGEGIGMQFTAISGLAVLIMGIVALSGQNFVRGRVRI